MAAGPHPASTSSPAVAVGTATPAAALPAWKHSGAPYPPVRYAWYVVGVLTLISILFYVDQEILSLLVAPIRRDFRINDTQMSLLMGFGYALIYSLVGIAFGRLVDSHSRRAFIAGGCTLWSAATAACGLARSYAQLLWARIGVGVGEGTLFPAVYSLIADYFPKEKLAQPMSVLSVSLHIGQGLAYVLGGLVIGLVAAHGATTLPWLSVSVKPWQIVFFAVGLPGFALALLMYTVKEPARRDARQASTPGTAVAPVPLREVLRYLRRHKGTFICHNLGFSLSTLTSYSVWGPSLFIRSYGWSAMHAGVAYGLATMIAGTLGVLAGGTVADRLARRGYIDANMRLGVITSLAWFPTGLLFPLVPSAGWALALLVPSYFFVGAPWGAAAAALQQMTPNEMRGQVTAIYRFAIYGMAGVFTPTFVALMTDYVFRNGGALKYSIAISGALGQLGAVLLLSRGLGYFRSTLESISAGRGAAAEY